MINTPIQVFGYHGTSREKANIILSEGFRISDNDYDWLGEGMNCSLYSDVILLRDLPDEGVYNGDIGTVVVRVASPLANRHDVDGLETGYSVEFFDMLGNTVAIVTLPMSCFRSPSGADRPTVR